MSTIRTIAHRAPVYGRATVRLAIALGVLLFCIAADLTWLAFDLGRQTGAAVHARNDQLAAVFRAVLAPTDRPSPAPVVAPVIAEPVATEPAPSIADLFAAQAAEIAASDARLYRTAGRTIANVRSILAAAETEAEPAARAKRAPNFEAMTVAQLRAHTGIKSRNMKKADLIRFAQSA